MSITVYTKPACVACNQTKKTLDKMGLSYNVVDITEDAAAYDKVVSMGFMSAPVVVTDEGGSWAGYQPEKLKALN